MKVVFISLAPPKGINEYPPTGLLSLAAMTKMKGHDVSLYDAGDRKNRGYFSCEELITMSPDIAAFTTYTCRMRDIYSAIRELKKNLPGCIVVAGGPHASALPEETMKECRQIDYVVRGEGEITFCELLDAVNERKHDGMSSINGLVYRDEQDKVCINSNRPLMPDLDSLPLPAYDLVAWVNYIGEPIFKQKSAAVYSSRGCPFGCEYCQQAIFGRSYRRRSPKSMVEELQVLKEVYGIRAFYFFEDLFAVDEKWLTGFYSEMRQRDIGLPWACLGRVNNSTRGMFRSMRENNCIAVYLGVESGSQEVLDSIGKKTRLEDIEKRFIEAREEGLVVGAYYMIGNRSDTFSSIDKTIKFAGKINAHINYFSICVPFPGTKIYPLVNLEDKSDWTRFEELSANPLSVCGIAPGDLVKLRRNAVRKTMGSLKYLFYNVFADKTPFHIRIYCFKTWVAARFPGLPVLARRFGILR